MSLATRNKSYSLPDILRELDTYRVPYKIVEGHKFVTVKAKFNTMPEELQEHVNAARGSLGGLLGGSYPWYCHECQGAIYPQCDDYQRHSPLCVRYKGEVQLLYHEWCTDETGSPTSNALPSLSEPSDCRG